MYKATTSRKGNMYAADHTSFILNKNVMIELPCGLKHFSVQYHEINYVLVNSGLNILAEMKHKVMQNSPLNYFLG